MKRLFFIWVLLLGTTAVMGQKTFSTDEVHAFATLAEGVDLKALDSYEVKVNTMVGRMMTVTIPSKRYDEFVASGLCSYIDKGHCVRPLLDKARADLGVDYIHQGINLPQGYDGSGVVVGVIDIGFHYGHPSFYDSTGSSLRIKRVWQQNDNNGTAPDSFTYGTELTTTAEILAAVTDMAEEGHGSHVAGIAAGCGAPDGTGCRYHGMAPAADIVMVSSTMDEPGIMDGIRYIHRYARSVGKPCVINMSLGSLEGPHDGLSPYEVMLNEYLSGVDSLVIVVSAANSGGSKNHLHHLFSPTDTVMRTYGNIGRTSNFMSNTDCWGRMGDQFSLSVALYDKTNNQYTFVTETPIISSTIDSSYQFSLVSPRDSVYQCNIAVSSNNPLNHRPNIRINILKGGVYRGTDVFALTIRSDSADVHLWSDFMNFSSNGNTLFSDGDDEYTIGGAGGNSDAVISVGSYATRTVTVSASGEVTNLAWMEEGDLSNFSSRGPTWDGRVKPDICAPGQLIVSVFSTPFIPYYNSTMLFDSTLWNGETYYYCLMQGTSMSSPAMAGIVALWLQHNASLNVDSVRTLLHSTGLTDRFTGPLPATGSNLWGWGKVNAFAGLPEPSVPMHYVNVDVDNIDHGMVTGRGRVPEGTHVISATAFNGYAFTSWSDGNTDNPRTLNITSDTIITALFDIAACDTVSQFPWEIEFSEGALNCWDNIARVGNQPWLLTMNRMTSMATPGMNDVDNWLVSPWVIPTASTALFYSATSFNGNDSLAIVAITAEGDTLTLSDERIVGQEERHTSLTPVVGQPVRLAFHHHATVPPGYLTLSGGKVDYLQGIEDIDNSKVRIEIAGRTLSVYNPDGDAVGIYDIMGRQLAHSQSPILNIQLPAPGVYIVRAGEHTSRKIVIR